MKEYNYILDKNHQPIPEPDIIKWGEFFQKDKNRRVGDDEIQGVRVSTVFLGIDHNYGEGEPILFETMIFGGEEDGYQDRYSTWEKAEKGHKELVRKLQNEIKS